MALDSLVEQGPEALDPLVASIPGVVEASVYEKGLTRRVRALASFGEQAHPCLEKLTHHSKPEIREKALSTLLDMKAPNTIDVAGRLLDDADSRVRFIAIKTHHTLDPKRNTEKLIALFDGPKDDLSTYVAIAKVLKKAGDETGLEKIRRDVAAYDRVLRLPLPEQRYHKRRARKFSERGRREIGKVAALSVLSPEEAIKPAIKVIANLVPVIQPEQQFDFLAPGGIPDVEPTLFADHFSQVFSTVPPEKIAKALREIAAEGHPRRPLADDDLYALTNLWTPKQQEKLLAELPKVKVQTGMNVHHQGRSLEDQFRPVGETVHRALSFDWDHERDRLLAEDFAFLPSNTRKRLCAVLGLESDAPLKR